MEAEMQSLIIATSLLLGAAAALPSDPDRSPLSPDGMWEIIRTEDGCAFVRSGGGDNNVDSFEGVTDVHRRWSGSCDADGLVSGPGVISTTYRMFWGPQRKTDNFQTETQATAANGLFEGAAEQMVVSDSYGPMEPFWYGTDNPTHQVFRGGCPFAAADGSPWYEGCSPADGPRLVAEVRARGVNAYFGGASAIRAESEEVLDALPRPEIQSPLEPVGAGSSGCGSSPAEAMVGFDREFGALQVTYPNPGTAAGTNRQYAYSVFMGERGLPILESYRPCMAEADYQTNLKALTGMRDVGRTGCEATSSTPGQRQAYVP